MGKADIRDVLAAVLHLVRRWYYGDTGQCVTSTHLMYSDG